MKTRVCRAEQRLGTLVSKFAIPVRLEVSGTDLVDFSCSTDVGEVQFIGTNANDGAYIQFLVLYIETPYVDWIVP